MLMRKVLGVMLPAQRPGTAASGKRQLHERQVSSHWLEIRVVFSGRSQTRGGYIYTSN